MHRLIAKSIDLLLEYRLIYSRLIAETVCSALSKHDNKTDVENDKGRSRVGTVLCPMYISVTVAWVWMRGIREGEG